FFFSSRRRHTRFSRDWSSDVCSSDLKFPVPSADLHWLTSYYRGASTMQPDQLLVPCPKCHAWPMAVHAGKRKWASDAPMVRFTCAKCGHQEEERLGGPYTKRESSRQHEIAGGGF